MAVLILNARSLAHLECLEVGKPVKNIPEIMNNAIMHFSLGEFCQILHRGRFSTLPDQKQPFPDHMQCNCF